MEFYLKLEQKGAMSLVKLSGRLQDKIWMELSDVELSKRTEWAEERKKSGIHHSIAGIPNVPVREESSAEEYSIKETIEEWSKPFGTICSTCAFIHTDSSGRVIDVIGSEETKSKFQSLNIQPVLFQIFQCRIKCNFNGYGSEKNGCRTWK